MKTIISVSTEGTSFLHSRQGDTKNGTKYVNAIREGKDQRNFTDVVINLFNLLPLVMTKMN